jgi:hypothetical protein
MPKETVLFPSQISRLLKSFCDKVKAILNEKFIALYVLAL